MKCCRCGVDRGVTAIVCGIGPLCIPCDDRRLSRVAPDNVRRYEFVCCEDCNDECCNMYPPRVRGGEGYRPNGFGSPCHGCYKPCPDGRFVLASEVLP